MSSALAMILAAGMTVPGDVPKQVPEEMEQGLDLRGKWKGFARDDKGLPQQAEMIDGRVILSTRNSATKFASFKDEGGGRFRMDLSRRTLLGIYRQDGDYLALCFRDFKEGGPTEFQGGGGSYLLILHRVKPRK